MRCDRPVVFLPGDLLYKKREEGKTKNEDGRVVFLLGDLLCKVSAKPFEHLASGLILLRGNSPSLSAEW